MNLNGKSLTLSEASKYSGLSVPSLRRMINGGKFREAYKIDSKTGRAWVIPISELNRLNKQKPDGDQAYGKVDQRENDQPYVPLNYFEDRRKEWEFERERLINDAITLRSGLDMYRYKFEELDKQLKLLPAPPEVVTSKLQETEQDRQQKTEALAQAQKILQQTQEVKERYKASIQELKAKLQEEEQAKETLRAQWELAQAELKRPWWKKLFGMK